MNGIRARLVEELASKVVATVADREPGHCLQIPHVPADIADGACELVARQMKAPDTAAVVVRDPDPEKPWQARPSRVVELRNLSEEAGGRLVLFLPAGQHLAAEDSFGRSTFEELDLADLNRDLVERLRQELLVVAPDVAERADVVVDAVQLDAKFGVGDLDLAAYYERLTERPTRQEIGLGLVELGLLPDTGIADEDGSSLSVRLARNRQHVDGLADHGSPADRLQAIPFPPDLAEVDEIRSALVRALDDGTVDKRQILRRLESDATDGSPLDFGPLLAATATTAQLHELAILRIYGDFKANSDPLMLTRSNAAVRIQYRCRPAANTVPGLGQLRLELLQVAEHGSQLSETGIESVKGSRSLPANVQGTWMLRVPTQNVDAGLYRLRLRAVDVDNHPLMETLSEQFVVNEDIEEIDEEVTPVPSVTAARVDALVTRDRPAPPQSPVVGLVRTEGDSGHKLPFTIRFQGVPGRWRLEVSRLLAQVQRYAFDAPRSLARYRVSLLSGELEDTLLPEEHLPIPEPFLDAREDAFAELARNGYPFEGEERTTLVELCDLPQAQSAIEQYVRAWSEALDAAESDGVLMALLSVDQVMFSDGPLADGVLIGPTHPLRLAWLLRYETVLRQWLDSVPAREAEADEVASLLDTLAPANVPHVVVTELGELRHLEPLDLYWGIWAPPSTPDVGAIGSLLRDRLELPRSALGGVNVSDVVARIRRYLAAHPYVDLLELNFVQPGTAQLVLQALLALQADSRTEHLRYVVRLFATELSRSELGRALDDFMSDPEASKLARRNEADAFVSSTDDPLAPKLTYSKHAAEDLLTAPDRFPAHVTFFLDWFDLDVVAVPPAPDRQSLYAGGLIVDPVVVYRRGADELDPQWDEHVAPGGDSGDFFGAAFAAAERATARLLGAEHGSGTVPAVRLELDRVRRSILDAVHRYSDWVVVIDPVFSDDYLDSPPGPGEAPRYLIDSFDPGALEASRRIMISTRSKTELANLMQPVLHRYELEVSDDRVDVLLDALRALSAGLPLKLLNNPTQAVEALSLALAEVFLASRGVLRRALVIPLDMHQDLFREAHGQGLDSVDLRRTDLAVLRIDAEQRHLAVSLVEVKARGELGETTPRDLLEHIEGQLENSRSVLRRRLFSAEVRQRPGSLAGALMVRRLTRILSRYLDRAVRYGFMDAAVATGTRPFIATLDQSFTVSFENHAILFDLDGSSRDPERVGSLRVQRIGRDDILDMLSRTQTPVGTRLPEGTEEVIETVFDPELGAAEIEDVPGSAEVQVPAPAEERRGEVTETEEEGRAREEPEAEAVEEVEGPRPEDVLLVGSTAACSQFGIVGRLVASDRVVGYDTGDTNVVSIFGVQGSGKSYTVGNLIEASLMQVPSLNLLHHPLGAVVFHYSSNETYLPEFASMSDPNDDPVAAATLEREYGAVPAGIDDVSILVPPSLVLRRQSEFPAVDVHPLVLSTRELTVPQWKLLMGVEGGDQMYVRAMTNVFRRLRDRISLDALRDGVDDSSLSPQQKNLAQTRIEFVEAFAADEGGAGSHLRPGRLLIVDVRDPLMDESEALALFMVLLRLLAQATDASGRRFSKLIVFDEAHKYMGNPTLTNAIVETVREMRHLGTSVVIASQNPPSVPRDVIELSSVVVAHKFTSPQWLEHIRKVNEAFARDLAPPQLAALAPGEAFVWSRDGADELRRPQRVRMRPRLTRHGGGTRRAGDE